MKDPALWNEDDLLALITNGIPESLSLDYKDSRALENTEPNKNSISKDVSSFANSAGGTLVYGMIEEDQRPKDFDDGCDSRQVPKEWLEQVIHGNIQPPLDGVVVNQVVLTQRRPGRVCYVVVVPKGLTAYQASDKRYYKRYNSQSVPMEHYEIMDVLNRVRYPVLAVTFSHVRLSGDAKEHQYLLKITVSNEGSIRAQSVKLVFLWPNPVPITNTRGFNCRTITSSITFHQTELSVHRSDPPLFPGDEWQVSDDNIRPFMYRVDEKAYDFIMHGPILEWQVFADDMPPISGQIPIAQLQNF